MARVLVSNRNMRGSQAARAKSTATKIKNSKKVESILQRQNNVIPANFGDTATGGSLAEIDAKLKSAIPMTDDDGENNALLINPKKAVTKKKTVAKKTASKKTAAKKKKPATARKTSTQKKATAKKTAAKKTTAKKTTARKTSAKKTAVKKGTVAKTKKAKTTARKQKTATKTKQPDLFSADKNSKRVQKRPVGISAIKTTQNKAEISADIDTAPLPRSASVQLYKPNGIFSQVGYWFRQYSRRMLKPAQAKQGKINKSGKRKIKAHEMLDELNRLAAENKALRAKLTELNEA